MVLIGSWSRLRDLPALLREGAWRPHRLLAIYATDTDIEQWYGLGAYPELEVRRIFREGRRAVVILENRTPRTGPPTWP